MVFCKLFVSLLYSFLSFSHTLTETLLFFLFHFFLSYFLAYVTGNICSFLFQYCQDAINRDHSLLLSSQTAGKPTSKSVLLELSTVSYSFCFLVFTNLFSRIASVGCCLLQIFDPQKVPLVSSRNFVTLAIFSFALTNTVEVFKLLERTPLDNANKSSRPHIIREKFFWKSNDRKVIKHGSLNSISIK